MSFLVAGPSRSAAVAPQRPLWLVGTVGGAVAAFISLGICCFVAVIGWYLSDAGAHGSAASGVRVGALAWLAGHGTGLNARGVAYDLMPLGITALVLWVTWRVGRRVGTMVADHGPDADGIKDGSRDFVVPTAGMLFTAGYTLVATVVAIVASGNGEVASGAALFAALTVSLFVGLPAIALDSGRLGVWAADLPADLHGIVEGVRALLVGWLTVSAVAFLIVLLANSSDAVNVISASHVHGGSLIPYLGAMLLVLPNAIVYAGSYLINAPFMIGLHTSVAPGAVHVDRKPQIPWLAATPTVGSGWFYLVLLLPVAVAVWVAFRVERTSPAPSLAAAAVRGATYSLLAAVGVTMLGWWAGGAIGQGLMAGFGTSAGSMFVHALEWLVAPSVVAAAGASWYSARKA